MSGVQLKKIKQLGERDARSGKAKSHFLPMKINKEWHLKNRMPKNPTLDQRIEWHLEHKKNCSCREMPEKLKLEIRKRTSRT